MNKGMEQSICRSLVSKAHPTSHGLECDWPKRLCGVGEGNGPQDWMHGEGSMPRDPGIGQLAIRGRHGDGTGVVGFPQLGGRSRGRGVGA